MYSAQRYPSYLTRSETPAGTHEACRRTAQLRLNSEDGFPHSEICGSKVAHTSPQLIAACHVLHRLCMPRHPPIALTSRLRIHTTIDNPACMTGADISVVWFEHHKTQMFVIRHGLGVRSDLSAR